jgi:hypothetical protein
MRAFPQSAAVEGCMAAMRGRTLRPPTRTWREHAHRLVSSGQPGARPGHGGMAWRSSARAAETSGPGPFASAARAASISKAPHQPLRPPPGQRPPPMEVSVGQRSASQRPWPPLHPPHGTSTCRHQPGCRAVGAGSHLARSGVADATIVARDTRSSRRLLNLTRLRGTCHRSRRGRTPSSMSAWS